VHASTPVDLLWTKFLEICNIGLDSVPTKLSFTRHNQPWITGHIKRLSYKKKCAYNHAREINNSDDWTKYHSLKRLCQHECHAAFNKYVYNLVDRNKNVLTKKLWTYIKSKKQDHTGIGALTYQGNTYTDSTGKAKIFADYFSSVFTHEDISHIPDLDGTPLPNISPLQIHVEGNLCHKLHHYGIRGILLSWLQQLFCVTDPSTQSLTIRRVIQPMWFLGSHREWFLHLY